MEQIDVNAIAGLILALAGFAFGYWALGKQAKHRRSQARRSNNMAGYPHKKNAALVYFTSVVSQANPAILQANPTIAAGD